MPKLSSFLIVIGTSAGGLEALSAVISDLPADLDAPVLIVQHLSPVTTGKVLVQALSRTTTLTCKMATDGEPLKKGTIYMAPPDYHLVVQSGKVVLIQGPHENRWRPSIDMLFRSAAADFNSRVIGVVLTGLLDDGTAGLKNIKQAGGTTIVQDPADARYPDMPLNASQNVETDYLVPLAEIGSILSELIKKPLPPEAEVPEALAREADISVRVMTGIEATSPLGNSTYFTCPDCGGVLTETDGPDVQHYRCHTGHSYTANTLLQQQKEEYENTLWVALRMLEERKNMLSITAHKDRNRGLETTAALLEERAKETDTHIQRLRELLLSRFPEEQDYSINNSLRLD